MLMGVKNCSPVTSKRVEAHRRDNVCWGQLHASISLEILVRAAEQPSDETWLLTLFETMHKPHCLPIEIWGTLCGEECVYAGVIQLLCWLLIFLR